MNQLSIFDAPIVSAEISAVPAVTAPVREPVVIRHSRSHLRLKLDIYTQILWHSVGPSLIALLFVAAPDILLLKLMNALASSSVAPHVKCAGLTYLHQLRQETLLQLEGI